MENLKKFKQFELKRDAQKFIKGGTVTCSFGGEVKTCSSNDLMTCSEACAQYENCGGCAEVIE